MNKKPAEDSGDCERFESLIEAYLAWDIAPADLETLQRHSATCSACREMMELHGRLSALPEEVAQPAEHEFSDMRAAVLGRIRATEPGRSRSDGRASDRQARVPIWRRWQTALLGRPAYAGAIAVVLLAVGFLIGRLGTGQPEFGQDLLVEEVVRQASLERGLDGYWDSPFIYSNVSFHQQTNGTVRLDFDVTRHVSVTRPLDSPLTREMLVHAMIDPTAMGSRLMAIGVAGRTMDVKLREAMVFILLNDPSLPVRLRSLEILSKYASDPAVQDALLMSLSQDPAVQIRLLALESLAGEHVGSGIIRQALGESLDETDRAVLHRAIELMGES